MHASLRAVLRRCLDSDSCSEGARYGMVTVLGMLALWSGLSPAAVLFGATVVLVGWELLRKPRRRRRGAPALRAVEVAVVQCPPAQWDAIRTTLDRQALGLRAIIEAGAVRDEAVLDAALDAVSQHPLDVETAAVVSLFGHGHGSGVRTAGSRVQEALANARGTVPATVHGRVSVHGGQSPVPDDTRAEPGVLYLDLLTEPSLATDIRDDLWRWTLQVGIPATAGPEDIPPEVRMNRSDDVAREVVMTLGARPLA